MNSTYTLLYTISNETWCVYCNTILVYLLDYSICIPVEFQYINI